MVFKCREAREREKERGVGVRHTGIIQYMYNKHRVRDSSCHHIGRTCVDSLRALWSYCMVNRVIYNIVIEDVIIREYCH